MAAEVSNTASEPFPLEDVEGSIPARFARVVGRHGRRLAVATEARSFPYDELDRASDQVAHALLERRTDAEEPVALLVEGGAWTVAALLGALKAGKIYAALDPKQPPARLAGVLSDAAPGLVLADAAHLTLAREVAPPGVGVLEVEALAAGPRRALPRVALDPGRGAALIYTSGSTGEPKGVLHDHRGLLFEARRVARSFPVGPDDRLALLHSFSSAASLRRIFPALLTGASLHPLDLGALRREDLPAWFVREGITVSNGRRLLRDCEPWLTGPGQFPKLRLVTFGGEPTLRRDVERFRRYLAPGCRMLINFTTTETGSDRQFVLDKGTELTEPLPPVGFATEGTEVRLLDAERRPVAPGEVGEIAVRSRYLARGYWRDPELTRRRFLPDPEGGEERIYLTGDLGRLRADGCLFCLGRLDSQLKVRGYRVEALEVEAALLDLGPFTEAAALALSTAPERPDGDAEADGDERVLVAFLVAGRPPAPAVGELRAALAAKLPGHMIPSHFVVLDGFPRVGNGKVDRAALAAHWSAERPWLARPDLGRPVAAPRSPLERLVARLFAERLGVVSVGLHDSFVELGGDSLRSVRLLARLRDLLGVELPPDSLFLKPTVAETCRELVAREPEPGWAERAARQEEDAR